jgi:hypothetical protein
MPVPEKPSNNSATLTAAGWSGVVLALIALVGLFYAPSMRTIWIVLLLLGAASVPQTWLALRREQQRERRRDAD